MDAEEELFGPRSHVGEYVPKEGQRGVSWVVGWKDLFWIVPLAVIVVIGFFVTLAEAYTAKVTFTPPNDATHMTVVLVSEISGEYGGGFGQRSEPGAESVEIGNIKPSTEYFFSAYCVDPVTWEKSDLSPEMAYTTGKYAEQTVIDLPPMPMGDIQVNITFIQEE